LSTNSSKIIFLRVDNDIVGSANWESVEVASQVSPCIKRLWAGWVEIKKLDPKLAVVTKKTSANILP